eukprot:14824027-Alexandrium_andersonii.AAC.1
MRGDAVAALPSVKQVGLAADASPLAISPKLIFSILFTRMAGRRSLMFRWWGVRHSFLMGSFAALLAAWGRLPG